MVNSQVISHSSSTSIEERPLNQIQNWPIWLVLQKLVVWMAHISMDQEAEKEIRWEPLLSCSYRIFPATHFLLVDIHPSKSPVLSKEYHYAGENEFKHISLWEYFNFKPYHTHKCYYSVIILLLFCNFTK